MTTLDTLRVAGLAVRADGGELVIRGPLSDELKTLAQANKPQILADLAEEADLIAFHCQACNFTTPNHPWPGQARRCIRCGWADNEEATP